MRSCVIVRHEASFYPYYRPMTHVTYASGVCAAPQPHLSLEQDDVIGNVNY